MTSPKEKQGIFSEDQRSGSGEFNHDNLIQGGISRIKLEEISHRVAESTFRLISEATDNAIQRSDHSDKSSTLIKNAIDKRFSGYTFENSHIALQLATEEYQRHANDTKAFLMPSVLGSLLCVDERIPLQAFFDPLVATSYRRPQGLMETRLSTKTGADLPNDFDLVAGVETKIVMLGERIGIENVELLELTGSHIDSYDPVGEGCAVAMDKAVLSGEGPNGMKHGYLQQYYKEQGRPAFHTFDYIAKSLTAKSTTVDCTFDTSTQGTIIGLRKECKNFSPDLSLRDNLLHLAYEKKILMTELLSHKFHDSISSIAESMGITNSLDVQHFRNFANNSIIIGRVARELTIQQEKTGFDFIPKPIGENKTPAAMLAIAYHALRNAAYLVLGNIQPEMHFLRHHLGKIVRVGPIGGKYLVENPPFIHNTPHGGISDADLREIPRLAKIARTAREKQGNGLETEGMIIMSTGAHSGKRYANKDIALEEAILTKSTVRSNAAKTRGLFGPDVPKGKIIVLGCIYKPETNELASVV